MLPGNIVGVWTQTGGFFVLITTDWRLMADCEMRKLEAEWVMRKKISWTSLFPWNFRTNVQTKAA